METMKTINSIISNSALGSVNNTCRYAVLFLFSGILFTLFSLLIFMLNNVAYVSAQFNF